MEKHPKEKTGLFDCVVVDHGFFQTPSGTLGLEVHAQTELGEIRGTIWLTEKAFTTGSSGDSIRAIGYSGEKLQDLNDQPAICKGNKFVGDIRVDKDQNGTLKNFASIAWFYPAGYVKSHDRIHDDSLGARAAALNALLPPAKASDCPV